MSAAATERSGDSRSPEGEQPIEIVITRRVDAPREVVWRAWTEPERVARWWGPHGFATTHRSMDVRPGGVWRFVMHGPDGRDYENRIEYTEVAPPELLAYRHAGEGQDADVRFESRVSFEVEGQGTRLTMRMRFASAEDRSRVVEERGAVEGGLEHASRLAEYVTDGRADDGLALALPSERDLVLRRELHAPPGLVFEALSRPEHVRRWWGSRDHTMTVCEMDFRPGGAWRIVMREPGGREHPFCGHYEEIVPPERIVQTFTYDVEGIRDHPALETIELRERDGHTVLTNTMRHATRADRDQHMQAGMEAGAAESLARLAELLSALVREG